MSDHKSFRRTLALAAVSVTALLGHAQVAQAQQAAPANAETESERLDYNIPAQSLSSALAEYARQSRSVVSAPPRLIEGRQSPGVSGEFTPPQALQRLLSGTGLHASRSNAGVLTLAADAARPTHRRVEANAAESAEDEIVVTAQKRGEQRLQEVPVPVSALSAENLIETNAVSLQDYYMEAPSFNILPNFWGVTNLVIRGVSTGAFGNPTVGVMVDEAPFSGSTGKLGNIIPDFDPSDLDRIEILRGPQGTLYGANSMGGLVRFVTVDPSTASRNGHVQMGVNGVHNGDEAGYTLRGGFNLPLSNNAAMRASAFHRRDPGYIDNVATGEDAVNSTDASGGRAALLWEPSNTVTLRLSALYQEMRGHGLAWAERQPGLGDLEQNYLPGVGSSENTYQAYSAVLNADLGFAEFTSITGYNVTEHSEVMDFTGIFGGLSQSEFGVGGAPTLFDTYGDKFTQEVRLFAPLHDNIDLLVGAFYTQERTDELWSVSAADPATGQSVGLLTSTRQSPAYSEAALFGDLTFQLSDRFEVQIGGRYSEMEEDYEDTISDGALNQPGPIITPGLTSSANVFTYLLTPKYQLTDDLMIYARFASGYRPGGSNLALCATRGYQCSYDPDQTDNYEIGLKGDIIPGRLSLDASLYYIDWRDIQINLTLPDPPFDGYTSNGSSAASQGVELAVTARPMDGLNISLWTAYSDAALTEAFPANSTVAGREGDRLPNSSRWSGNLSVTQTFAVNGAGLGHIGADLSYVGSRRNIFTADPATRGTLPSYAKLDLRGGVDWGAWSVNAFVNNVTDERGVLDNEIANGLLPFTHIYIRPRSFGFNLTRNF